MLACYLQAEADPYPASQFDADPGPAYHFDTDPDPTFQFDMNPCRSGSGTLYVTNTGTH